MEILHVYIVLEGMYRHRSQGTWFKLASGYFQTLVSHHNGGKPEGATKDKMKAVCYYKPGSIEGCLYTPDCNL